MILVVSDLHLGRAPDQDPTILADLADCVAATEPATIIFLGDVFDAFIETPGHIPPEVHAWSAQVQTWRNQGLDIHYLMGNHDRWHRTWVRDRIGRMPVRTHIDLDIEGHRVRLEHGDAGEPHGPMTRFARWVSDLRIVYRLCTILMPMGGLQALAAWVSRRAGNPDPSPTTIAALEAYALRMLAETSASGMVMGHAHRAQLRKDSAARWYVNTGDWYNRRTFAILEASGVRLAGWEQGRVQNLDSAPFPG